MVKTRIVPNYPALLSTGSEKNLIITDLHLGSEGNLSLNKVFVEKNVTVKKTIREIGSQSIKKAIFKHNKMQKMYFKKLTKTCKSMMKLKNLK